MIMSTIRVNWRPLGLLTFLIISIFWIFYHVPRGSQTLFSTQGQETEKSAARAGLHEKLLKEKDTRIEYLEQLLKKEQKPSLEMEKKAKKFTGQKLVHLDLKGAPPKMNFLLKVLPHFRKWGATGLLVEYEDMFPYTGELEVIQSSHAYSANEIKSFLDEAKKNDLTVVPLVQTFGHLEFLLKHKEFAHLRETEHYTNSLCPINKESVPLVKTMINQVMSLHPDVQWFHVGGDEVWNIKTCPTCTKDKRNAKQLFVDHMKPIFQHVRSKGKVPLFWDDMMRYWSVVELEDASLGGLAEPMVWNYVANPAERFPPDLWQRYAAVFSRIWVGSAFKGATFPWSNFAPISFHVTNNLNWLHIITSLPPTTEVVGIALTGWSRYDHYATMCELLPAALPSLAFCLAALNNGKMDDEIRVSVAKELDLPRTFSLSPAMSRYEPPKGDFPGSELYTMVAKLEIAIYKMNGVLHLEGGWMLDRQESEKFLSYHQIEAAVKRVDTALEIMNELKGGDTAELLLKVYDSDTVREWIHDKIESHIKRLTDKKTRLQQLQQLAQT